MVFNSCQGLHKMFFLFKMARRQVVLACSFEFFIIISYDNYYVQRKRVPVRILLDTWLYTALDWEWQPFSSCSASLCMECPTVKTAEQVYTMVFGVSRFSCSLDWLLVPSSSQRDNSPKVCLIYLFIFYW